MKALSLSGGGFQGLFTALLLEKMEEASGSLLNESFGMFAGSSVGSIMAAAAAVGMPMRDVVHIFRHEGSKIFSDRPAPSGNAAIMRDFMRYVNVSKYTGSHLNKVVSAYCGDTRMGDLKTNLLITAVRLHDGEPIIFTPQTHPDTLLREVVMAATAAPMIFPPSRVDGVLHADGAIYANCPDSIALDYLKHTLMTPLEEISMLSVGAMNQSPPLSAPTNPNMGILAWLGENRIFRTIVSAQAIMAAKMVSNEIGERYERVDANPNGYNRMLIGLDVADSRAINAIEVAAVETWNEIMSQVTMAP